jgi:hypothetical protein
MFKGSLVGFIRSYLDVKVVCELFRGIYLELLVSKSYLRLFSRIYKEIFGLLGRIY